MAVRTCDVSAQASSARIIFYRFPCCGLAVELSESEHVRPLQFRADGCSVNPIDENHILVTGEIPLIDEQ